jgi:hypothetical protein
MFSRSPDPVGRFFLSLFAIVLVVGVIVGVVAFNQISTVLWKEYTQGYLDFHSGTFEGDDTLVSLPLSTETDPIRPTSAIPEAVLPNHEPTTPTPFILPTPTPLPMISLMKLTNGGCCPQPFWSSDSQSVMYLDNPVPSGSPGLWSVNLRGNPPELVSERLGLYSHSLVYLAYPEEGQTIVESKEVGQRWVIPNQGQVVKFCPQERHVAWIASSMAVPIDKTRHQVWTSQIDGSEARIVWEMYGGRLEGWFPDGRLLVAGRATQSDSVQSLWAVSLVGEPPTLLAQGFLLRSILSPGGSWLAYQGLFSEDAAENGLFIVHTHTGESHRLDLFGAFRWRDDHRLIIIPMDQEPSQHVFWEIDALNGSNKKIPLPEGMSIRISAGDWSVSPDGKHIVFVSAEDKNIWVITLPQE